MPVLSMPVLLRLCRDWSDRMTVTACDTLRFAICRSRAVIAAGVRLPVVIATIVATVTSVTK